MARSELRVRFTQAEPGLRHYIRPELRGGRQVTVEHWERVDLDAAVDLRWELPVAAVDEGGTLSFELHDGTMAWAKVESPERGLAPEGRRWVWAVSA